MKIREFFTGRTFLANLTLLVAIILVLFFGLNLAMRAYTHHGESLTVPDFKGMSLEEVGKNCNERGLRYMVKDSTFVQGAPVFTVVEQSPKALSKVKKNRTIYLTLSSDNPPKVKLPNLIDLTLPRATVLLNGFGLKTGEITYVPGIAQNVVIRVLKNGREIEPGTFISKGSTVDLVLEDGYTNSKVEVQELRGLTIEEANFTLSGFGLNLGAVVYDKAVKDTSRAIIYKQRPLPGEDKTMSQGESIDVWLTTPEIYKEKYVKPSKDDE